MSYMTQEHQSNSDQPDFHDDYEQQNKYNTFYRPVYNKAQKSMMINGTSKERLDGQKKVGCAASFGQHSCRLCSRAIHPCKHSKSLNKTKGKKKRDQAEFRDEINY